MIPSPFPLCAREGITMGRAAAGKEDGIWPLPVSCLGYSPCHGPPPCFSFQIYKTEITSTKPPSPDLSKVLIREAGDGAPGTWPQSSSERTPASLQRVDLTFHTQHSTVYYLGQVPSSPHGFLFPTCCLACRAKDRTQDLSRARHVLAT